LRANLVGFGLLLIGAGIFLAISFGGALYGISVGIIGFVVMIFGIMSSGHLEIQESVLQQNQHGPIPLQQVAISVPLANQAQNMDYKFCSTCGSRMPKEYGFCNSCGHEFPIDNEIQPSHQSQPKFCMICGAEMPVDSGFSPECGRKQT
jgi:ribosomal protein L40E